jgi:hypothetical protein
MKRRVKPGHEVAAWPIPGWLCHCTNTAPTLQLLLLFNHSTSDLALVGENAQNNALYKLFGIRNLFLAFNYEIQQV